MVMVWLGVVTGDGFILRMEINDNCLGFSELRWCFFMAILMEQCFNAGHLVAKYIYKNLFRQANFHAGSGKPSKSSL